MTGLISQLPRRCTTLDNWPEGRAVAIARLSAMEFIKSIERKEDATPEEQREALMQLVRLNRAADLEAYCISVNEYRDEYDSH